MGWMIKNMGFLIGGCCLKSSSGCDFLWGCNLFFWGIHLLRELEDLLFLSIHDEVAEKKMKRSYREKLEV